MIYDSKFNHKWHRQSGLVDQSSISKMKMSIGGDGESILALLIQLNQLGSSRIGKGLIIINHNLLDIVQYPLLKGFLDIKATKYECSWKDIQLYFQKEGMNIEFRDSSMNTDIWVGYPKSIESNKFPKFWLIHGNGKALIGCKKMPILSQNKSTIVASLIDTPTLVSGISSLLHIYLSQNNYFWKQPISDKWITLTVRVDNISPEKALETIRSKYGEGIATMTSDRQGSLLRFRIPLDQTPNYLLNKLDLPHQNNQNLISKPIDVGPYNSLDENGIINFSSLNLPERLSDVNVLLLGIGGLGSWAAPSIISGCDLSNISMTIIDSDTRIESHNLNRQILYDINSLNETKVDAAKEKLIQRFEINPKQVSAICDKLVPIHISMNDEINSLETISMGDIFDEGQSKYINEINQSFDNMDLALSCLDNQYARTLLNKACLERNKKMINGGGESSQGLIEIFDDDSCMVCRYGREVAYSLERISCQEEGTRPVNSIVTTTAFVGSMMAVLTLCSLAKGQGYKLDMPISRDWFDGFSTPRMVGKLPWFEDNCLQHI